MTPDDIDNFMIKPKVAKKFNKLLKKAKSITIAKQLSQKNGFEYYKASCEIPHNIFYETSFSFTKPCYAIEALHDDVFYEERAERCCCPSCPHEKKRGGIQ